MKPKSKASSVPAILADEQRYLPRWETNNRVICQLEHDENTCVCMGKDLNPTGGCIVSPKKIPSGKKLKLEIFLTDKTSVKVDGEAVWKKSTAKGELLGIMFHKTSRKTQDLILKHAFEIPRTQ